MQSRELWVVGEWICQVIPPRILRLSYQRREVLSEGLPSAADLEERSAILRAAVTDLQDPNEFFQSSLSQARGHARPGVERSPVGRVDHGD